MSSTTASKKSIVDFLWDWAEKHSDWGKYLIDVVVKGEKPLSKEERSQIFDYFIDSYRKEKILPKLLLTKPVYSPSNKSIKVVSLSDIKGVNRLAKSQKLTFGDNLTVIYGENGTGKTGYGRILKSLGFSYDTRTAIYHNIYSKPEPKKAKIEYELNGAKHEFDWDGNNFNGELSNISVFNNNCVQLSLNDRQLIVSPSGFHLFGLVSSELNELSKIANEKIDSYDIAMPWIEKLIPGTLQYNFMISLNGNSKPDELKRISTFTEADEELLNQKELELSNVNKELLRTQISNITAQIAELDKFKEKISFAQNALSDRQWQNLLGLNAKITELENKTQSTIKELAESKGIKFYDSPQYKSFLKAAEDYIKKLDKQSYPQSDDKCVYCNQPLDESARELLLQYKTLLNDTTQNDLLKINNDKKTLLDQIQKIESSIIFQQSTFGQDEEFNPIQPKEVIEYSKDIAEAVEKCLNNTLKDGSKFEIDYKICTDLLDREKIKLVALLKEKQDVLVDIEKVENQLKSNINEMKDRKLLSTKYETVVQIIQNMKAIAFLRSKLTNFNTTAISKKTTEARDTLVRQDFDIIFNKELASLRKSHLKIDVNFGTEKGHSKVTQNINAHNLVEILSEGEQKAIALAEFLTELQLDNIQAPIIFDDPVNSLDHVIIDEVAKRLVEQSKNRQVIVFTHSILLLNSFIQQTELDHNKQANLKAAFYSVKNNFGETGIIDEVEEINSFSYYIKKLNAVLTGAKPTDNEAKLAAEGYGHLRSAIEVCVEEDILKKIIKRYRKGVAFPSLLRIDGSKIDIYKAGLNDIYEKCCVSIDGHSSPSEIHTTPEIAVLKADYEQFKVIRKEFTS